MKNKQDYNTKLLVIFSIVYELIIYMLNPIIGKYNNIVIFVSFGLFVSYFFLFLKKEKRNPLYLIFALGLLIRTFYILHTSIYDRQHDVGGIGLGQNGHLSYINILFNTHHLPTTIEWQFYHPPLWHFIGATWLHINNLFGIKFQQSLEGLQVLTLLFSTYSIIIVDKIVSNFKSIKEKYRYIICLLFAVHPTLILFSGSINNDCLLLFLELLIILLLINFYRESSWKNTIYLALATGFCVMTKSSGALMAIPIMYVFIIKLLSFLKNNKYRFIHKIIYIFKNKEESLKQLLLKIMTFALISLPIGLWHPIRNIIKFSSTKIPEGGDWLYIGDKSFISRFLIPNFHELFNYANMYNDKNLPTYIIKSSVFGEYTFNKLDIVAMILLIINIILIILSFIFMIQYLFQKNKDKCINMLLITWLVFMISMYIFNYQYPYRCSMDFRYIPVCLLPGIVIIFYQLGKTKNKHVRISIELLCYLFTLLCTIFMVLAI